MPIDYRGEIYSDSAECLTPPPSIFYPVSGTTPLADCRPPLFSFSRTAPPLVRKRRRVVASLVCLIISTCRRAQERLLIFRLFLRFFSYTTSRSPSFRVLNRTLAQRLRPSLGRGLSTLQPSEASPPLNQYGPKRKSHLLVLKPCACNSFPYVSMTERELPLCPKPSEPSLENASPPHEKK